MCRTMRVKQPKRSRWRMALAVGLGLVPEVEPPDSSLKLYGGAAFERVMHEFRCATYSIECPQVSIEKLYLLFVKPQIMVFTRAHYFHSR